MIQRHKARKLYEPAAQRFALPALGRGRRSRPARKMIRRRKLPEIAAESPASGARFVGQTRLSKTHHLKKAYTANLINFYTQLNFWQLLKLIMLKLIYQNAGYSYLTVQTKIFNQRNKANFTNLNYRFRLNSG